MASVELPALSTDLVPYFFDREHHTLVEFLRESAKDLHSPELDGAQIAARMGEVGLYRNLLPETGLPDVRKLCLIREVLGFLNPMADAIFAVQGLGSFPVAMAGSEEHQPLLEELRAGTRIAGFALTEPEAGSDVGGMQTTAARDGDSWRLTGHKTLISNVGIAQQYVVFANADPAQGKRGISAFLVMADSEGLTEKKLDTGDGHPLGELIFTDARAQMLGELGKGLSIAFGTLDRFRVSVGAAAVGMASRALAEAASHTRTRVQFGKPLSAQQLVQAHLADMRVDTEAARMMVLRAAHDIDRETAERGATAAMAKLFATEAAQRVVDRGVQLLGGRGVLQGNPLKELYNAVRPLRIYEGTSEIQRLIIGRDLSKGGDEKAARGQKS